MNTLVKSMVGALCAFGGGVLFIWMARWPQPYRMTRSWFEYFAEMIFAAAVMGCGCAAFFAPLARSLKVEGRTCEWVGYLFTFIGTTRVLLSNDHPLWAVCLVLIGFPVGKLCRRLAFPTTDQHSRTVVHHQIPN